MVDVGARCADVFAGAKGVCLRQGVSRSEVDFLGRAEPFRTLTMFAVERSFHSL